MARIDSEQRNKILRSAIAVFAERGLKGATIRIVGRAAGYNSALIYYYFENKETLFVEALKHILAGFFERLEKSRCPFTNARERIAYFVNSIYDYYEEDADRMQLMTVAISMHSDLVRKVIEDFLKERSILPLEIIAEGIEVGQFRKVNPLQAWWAILGACMLSMRLRQIIGKVKRRSEFFVVPEVSEMREGIIDMLTCGLSADATGGLCICKNSGKTRKQQR